MMPLLDGELLARLQRVAFHRTVKRRLWLGHPVPKWTKSPREGRDVVVLGLTLEGSSGVTRFEISPATVRE